ncbi:MAG: FeoA family protein [Actinomycetota bacterium]|nr:FeoA family protein [Actinomycetota bacterium]
MKSLKEMKPGEKGSVLSIEKGGDLRRRLLDMGVVKGAEVRVVRLAPLGDPMEVSIKGYNLTLRGEEAERIHIRVDG